MSEKRLYNVTIELEVVVIAEDDSGAEQSAREALTSGDIDIYDADCNAQPMTYYPSGWEEDAIPFGDREDADPDRTIKKWIEMGAAPDLQKLQSKIQRFRDLRNLRKTNKEEKTE